MCRELDLGTYRSRDKEASKDIPYCIECSWYYGSNVTIWCHGNCHHTIESEVHEGEEHEENIPEELLNCPVKANKAVDNETIHNCLKEDVWDLNKNLLKVKLLLELKTVHKH